MKEFYENAFGSLKRPSRKNSVVFLNVNGSNVKCIEKNCSFKMYIMKMLYLDITPCLLTFSVLMIHKTPNKFKSVVFMLTTMLTLVNFSYFM
jgi:hypothetical protein